MNLWSFLAPTIISVVTIVIVCIFLSKDDGDLIPFDDEDDDK